MFLEEGNFEAARQLIQGSVRQCPTLYKPAMKVLEGLISRRDLNGSLEMVEELFEISVRLRDESNLKVLLDSLLELDETNSRLLKTLTAVLIRMNDKEKLEGYLKRLVLVQLRADEVRDARESLNKLVVYGSSSFYLDLLNLINEAALDQSPEVMKKTVQKVIRALEAGSLEKDQNESARTFGARSVGTGLGDGFDVRRRDRLRAGISLRASGVVTGLLTSGRRPLSLAAKGGGRKPFTATCRTANDQ